MSLEDELKNVFFDEGKEHLASLEEDLIRLETESVDGGGIDAELVNRIFRSAHTIKGGAGSVGFTDLSQFTHTVENVLDQVRQHTLSVSEDLISILLHSVDCMSRMLDAAMGNGEPPDEDERTELIEHLNAFLGHVVDAASAAADAAEKAAETPVPRRNTAYDVTLKFLPDLFETGTDPQMLLTELADLGSLEITRVHSDALPDLENIDPHRIYLWWDLRLSGAISRDDLDGVFIFVADDHPITYEEVSVEPDTSPGGGAPADGAREARGKAEPRSGQRKGGLSSVRVDTDRLDRLVNLVGELVIGQSQVAQVALQDNVTPETVAAVEALNRITRQLQDEAMSMRMLPIGPTFVQFQRVVRDLAVAQGKKVNLEVFGQDTELDKSIIEKIGDPLKHMVRNAIDHGLETPAEREAAGKPAAGTLRLSAYHAEGSIMVEIADDGRGLDADAIARKAVQQGVIPEDHALTPDQIHQLIFHPGLSTASKVTDVSGRGVGMDVVKRNIDQLRGSVSIQTVQGKGTTFRITLPLTLAIIEGMAVAVGSETFIIPLLSIVESVRPRKAEVQTMAGGGEIVTVRGDALPLVRLHDELQVPVERLCPSEALVIIVENASERYCLMVNDILGQQQVVIKTIEQNYKKVDGIAGATILADGRVALILDIGALVRKALDRDTAMV